MMKITCLPDRKDVDVSEGDTILEATLRANVAHAHACGGLARCSTCRVWILEGLDNCAPRTDEERSLADSIGFRPEVRLACQTKVVGDVKLRRLVLDETDLEITSQLSRKRLGRCGEVKNVVVLFSDIRGFTALTETLSGYDVIFILNRYFFQVGDVIERNGGYIVDFYGDGVMALFGLDDDPDAPLHGVNAALEILDVVDHLKPYMEAMYDESFDVGIGMHCGPAVIGTVGSAKTEKLTGVGETINIASKIEAANKTADTRLLVSEDLYGAIGDSANVRDFIRVKLPGTSGRWTLYEIAGLQQAVTAALTRREPEDDTRQRYAGLDWIRVLDEADLPVGASRVVELDELDVLLIRRGDRLHAINNACPHLRLPLNDSEVGADGSITCRWHESCFDLETGEIKAWAETLDSDGRPPGMEQVGDVSKNRQPLSVFPVRVSDGAIWVSILSFTLLLLLGCTGEGPTAPADDAPVGEPSYAVGDRACASVQGQIVDVQDGPKSLQGRLTGRFDGELRIAYERLVTVGVTERSEMSYSIHARAGGILFGNGMAGKVPTARGPGRASYRYGAGGAGSGGTGALEGVAHRLRVHGWIDPSHLKSSVEYLLTLCPRPAQFDWPARR